MVEYICEKCSKKFSKKYNYECHQKRQRPCTKIEYYNSDAAPSLHQKNKENLSEKEESSDDDNIENNNGKTCNHCHKEFTRNSSLIRHLNENRCKILKLKLEKQLDEAKIKKLEEENEKIKKEKDKMSKQKDRLIKKLAEQVGATTNSHNNICNNNINSNNTVTNNIKIVAYGKEDLSHLSKRDWFKIFKENYFAMEALAIKAHFDKDKPEHQNIYISNLKGKYITVHDGTDWVVKKRKEIVDELYDDKAYKIFKKIEEMNNELPVYLVDKFDKIKQDYDDDKIKRSYIERLDASLYNNRKLPIVTHKIKEKI